MNRQFVGAKFSMEILDPLFLFFQIKYMGGVAQMVERSLSMREVPGSIPGASKSVFFLIDPVSSLFRTRLFLRRGGGESERNGKQ